MTGDLFTILDITKPDATGMSDHERGMLDFLKLFGRPHEQPFAWLDELNDCSLAFWTEASLLLTDLARRVHEIRLLKEKQTLPALYPTGKQGAGVGGSVDAPGSQPPELTWTQSL